MPFAFGGNSGDFSWDSFKENYANVNRAAAASGRMYTDLQTTAGQQNPYYANRGTDYMFSQYRPANMAENTLINIHRAGDELMNWQAGLAGLLGGEQAKEDWTFNPDKFKLSDWTGNQGWENMNQIKNFAASLPGQMVGGLIQAPGQLLGEVVAGTPYTEYKKSVGGAGRRAQNLNEPEFDANGNYLIPDYTLDAGQRAGQFVNAGINIASAFTGGAGRVFGSLGKRAFTAGTEKALKDAGLELGKSYTKKQFNDAIANASEASIKKLKNADSYFARAEKWEQRSKGLLRRTYEKTTGKDSDAVGIAGQMAFDAAEEAGEEFIQQYAEQGGRYKENVDVNDAITAAAWGALGGGLMSGGGAALNIGINKAGNAISNRSSQAKNVNQDSRFTFNEDAYNFQRQQQSKYLGPDAAERWNEQQRLGNERAASGPGTNVRADGKYMPHEGGLGADNIKMIARASQESMDIVANDFGVNSNYFAEVLEDPTKVKGAKTLGQALNILKGDKPVKIAIGRSPATKNGGYYIDLVDIFDGNGIMLNPMTFAQNGSDIDGDKGFVYFGADRFKEFLGYPSDFIADPEQTMDANGVYRGASQVPFWYSAIVHGYKNNPQQIHDYLADVLDQFVDANGSPLFTDEYSKRIVDALNLDPKIYDDDVRDYNLSKIFSDIQADVNSAIANGQIDPNWNGETVKDGKEAYGRILQQFGTDTDALIASMMERYDKRVDHQMRQIWNAHDSGISYDEATDLVMNAVQKRGTLGSVQTVSEMFRNLGLLSANLQGKGAITYRQFPQIFYSYGKEIEGGFFNYSDTFAELNKMYPEQTKTLIQTFIRASFGMSALGVNPTVAIEGIIDNMIISDVFGRFPGLRDGYITSDSELNNLLESYREIYNQYVDVYNDSKKYATTQGMKDQLDAVERKKINSIEDENFLSAFSKTFANFSMRNIFDPAYMTEEIANMTLDAFIKTYGKDQFTFNDVMSAYDSASFSDFAKKLFNNYGKSKKRLSNSIKKLIESYDTRDIVKNWSGQTKDFASYSNSAYEVMHIINAILEPDIAIQANILDPTAGWGGKLMSMFYDSSNMDNRLNAFVSTSLYTQFEKEYHIVKDSTDEAEIEQAINSLVEKSEISSTHRFIANSILNGNFTIFEIMTSLDRSFSEKENFWSTYVTMEDANADLLVDSLITEQSDFDVSGLSTRVRKAKTYAKKADALLLNNVREDIHKVKEYIQSNRVSRDTFNGFVRRGLNASLTSFDREALVSQLWEAAIIGKDAVEKGTIQTGASNKSAMMQVAYRGGLISFQEDLFGMTASEITLNQAHNNYRYMMMCLSDPSFQVTVVDEATGRNGIMNRNTLFEQAGVTLAPNADPEPTQWVEFFEACPQIATLVADTKIHPSGESATAAMEYGFVSSLEKYNRAVSGNNNTDEYRNLQFEDGMKATERWLLNDPDYIPFLYGCISDAIDSGPLNVNRLRSALLSAHNKIIKAAYRNALRAGSNHSVGRVWQDSKHAWYEKFNQIISNDLAQALDATNALFDMTAMTNDEIMNYEANLASTANNLTLLNVARSAFSNAKVTADPMQVDFQADPEDYKNFININANTISRNASVIRSLIKYSVHKEKTVGGGAISNQFVADLKEQIVNSGYNRQVVDKWIDKWREDIEAATNVNMAVDNYIITDNEIGLGVDAVVNKVIQLYDLVGEAAPSVESIRKDVQDKFNDGIDAVNKYRAFWINTLIGHEIESVNADLGTDINPATLQLYNQIQGFTNKMWEMGSNNDYNTYLRDYLIHEGYLKKYGADEIDQYFMEEDEAIPNLPIPKVTSNLVQAIISSARVEDDAGATTTAVSVNGGQMKLHFGIGYLPSTSNKWSSDPTVLTVEQLEQLVDNDPNVNLHKVLVNPTTGETATVNAVLKESQYEDMRNSDQIPYYDPLNNPHGITDCFLPASTTTGEIDWHRVTRIIQRIDSETMEGMVLKAKKKLGMKLKLVSVGGKSFIQLENYNINIEDIRGNNGADAQQNAMKQMLHAYRQSYAKIIAAEFKNKTTLGGLGYGMPQAQILASFLTPGLRVSIDTGEGIVDRVFDASAILGSAANWQQYVDSQVSSTVADDSKLTPVIDSARCFTATPNTIGFKILRDISLNGGDTLSQDEVIAENALDFSNWRFDNLKMSEVLNGFNPLRNSYSLGIKLSDSRTPVQAVLDSTSNNAFGASKENIYGKLIRPKMLDEKKYGKYKKRCKRYVDSISSNVQNKNAVKVSDRVDSILRVWLPKNGDASHLHTGFRPAKIKAEETLIKLQLELGEQATFDKNQYYYEHKTNKNSAILLASTNEKDIRDAIEYSIRSGNDLLVPDENLIRGNLDALEALGYTYTSDHKAIMANINGNDMMLWLVKPKFNTALAASATRARPQSYSLIHNPKDIRGILVDEENEFFSGDAGIYATLFEDGSGNTYGGGNIGVRKSSYARLSAHAVLKSPNSIHLATKAEVEDLITNKLANNMSYENLEKYFDFSSFKNVDELNMQSYVSKYLEDMGKQNSPEDAILRDNVGANMCLALLYDGNRFAPVLAPKNSFKEYSHVNVQLEGDDLWIPWGGQSTLEQDKQRNELGHLKLSVYDEEAFKGIVTLMPDEVNGRRYHYIGTGVNNLSNGGYIDYIISGETESGRAVGRELQFAKRNFYEINFSSHGSLIFKEVIDVDPKTGKKVARYEYNDFIQDMITKQGDQYKAVLQDFLDGDRGTAQKVISGRFQLTGDPELNSLIAKVIRNCMRNGQPWVDAITRVNYQNDAYVLSNQDFEFHTAFSGFDMDQLLKFYHNMKTFSIQHGGKTYNIPFCPNGIHEEASEIIGPEETRPLAFFDAQGRTWISTEYKGKDGSHILGAHRQVRWGIPRVTGEASAITSVNSTSSIAWQQIYARAYDKGFAENEYTKLADYREFLLNNGNYISEYARSRAREKMKHARQVDGTESYSMTGLQDRFRNASYLELRHKQEMQTYIRSDGAHRNLRIGESTIGADSKEWQEQVIPALEKFRRALKWDSSVMPFDFADQFAKHQAGATFESGSIHNDAPLEGWLADIESMCENLKDSHPMVVKASKTGKSAYNRVPIPYLNQYQIDMLWEHSETINTGWNSKEEFEQAIRQEGENTLNYIDKLFSSDRPKAARLHNWIEAIFTSNGWDFDSTRYLSSGVFQADYLKFSDDIIQNLVLSGEIDESEINAMKQLRDENLERLAKMKQLADRSNEEYVADSPQTASGKAVTTYYDVNFTQNKLLDRATQWVQFMAMLDPFMTVANVVDRTAHQTIQSKLLSTAAKGGVRSALSPYRFSDKKHAFTEEELDNIVNQSSFIELYAMIREASARGQLENFIAQASTQEDMLAWLKEEAKNGTLIDKTVQAGFAFGTGGRTGLKQQAKNFLQRWVQFVENDPSSQYWFQEDENGESLLRRTILGDDNSASRWLLDNLGSNGAETFSLQPTLRALQSARVGDLAQGHVIAAIWGDWARKHSMSNLAVTCFVSKFPQYSLNVTHRLLNWVLPMSTTYYLMTERLAATEMGQRLQLDNYQYLTSLKEALMVDMLHLGTSLMTVVLLGLSGAVEPPEDDRYLCNLDEWLFFGIRAKEVWWMRDILGMVMPLAAFSKSCQIGKPMFTLITDGITEACYSNPFLRVGDALELFVNPEGNIWEQYDRAKKDFEDVDSFIDFISGNMAGGSLRVFGQFITPAFVREIAQLGDYEHSYKKIYQTNALGSERDNNKTVKTTYQDAMIRKYTRNNPWMGTILDVILNPSTGYREDEMPLNLYYDDEQWNSMKENAQQSPDYILTVLQRSYQEGTLDELGRTGFYLDYDKKAEVSALIWDHYYEWRTAWNTFASDDGSDFYALGDGDFNLGRQRYYEYKEICESNQRYWKQFYYDVIQHSFLAQPMQQYYRYKTNYETDAAGEIYATGYHRGIPWLPFNAAPGTLTNPQGTAGYENNFMAVSAVTGNPMGQRALVPIEQTNEEWPDFEEWSANKDGQGFSSYYNGEYAKQAGLGSGSGTDTSSSSKKKTSSGYGSRGGSGGGGRSSGGSGGGRSGGSAPRIYASNATVNPVSPSRLMNSNRIQNTPDIDYLRPGFETKGSREAYKRGDI